MLNRIAINSSYPSIGRYPQRSVVATINSTLINLACQHIRAAARIMIEAPGVEMPTEAEQALETQHETQQREEQGFSVALAPQELAGYLKLVRDSLADDLLKHAGIVQNPLNDTRVYNPFDLGMTVEEMLDFRIKAEPPAIAKAVIDALVKALRVTPDEVLQAKAAQHTSEITFLKTHRMDILQWIADLNCGKITDDGAGGFNFQAYDLDDAEIVFDRLPIITQLRLFSAAMRGIMKGRQNELQGFLRQRPDAEGNMALLDSMLRDLFGKLDRLLAAPANKAALDEVISRGATMPAFPARPAPLEPSEADAAKIRHAQVVHSNGSITPAVKAA